MSQRRAGAEPGQDVLAAVVSSPASPGDDDEILDELAIVLMAAQEPPASALTNVVYELAARAPVAEQFRTEPDARSAITAEVIRLRPSASAALRTLTEPLQVDGHVMPAVRVVAAPSLLLHRDPHFFPPTVWPWRSCSNVSGS